MGPFEMSNVVVCCRYSWANEMSKNSIFEMGERRIYCAFVYIYVYMHVCMCVSEFQCYCFVFISITCGIYHSRPQIWTVFITCSSEKIEAKTTDKIKLNCPKNLIDIEVRLILQPTVKLTKELCRLFSTNNKEPITS